MTISLDHDERRKSVRLDLSVGYALTIEGREFKGLTGNISLGGVYLQEIDPPMADSFTSKTGVLRIEIPESPISLESRVVYVGSADSLLPAGVGVAFCDPDQESVSIIQDCLSKLS